MHFRKFCLLLLLLVINTASAQAIEVRYKVSRTHGLLNFVLAIAGDSGQAPGLNELFTRSHHNTEANRNLLAQWEELKSPLARTVTRGSDLPSRSSGHSVLSLITVQSIFSRDLPDLNERSLGLLAASEQLLLFRILKNFSPVYEELVWKKSVKELMQQQKLLSQLGSRVGLSLMFTNAMRFYKGNWPEQIAFTVGLYPIPYIKGEKNSTVSHSMGSVEEHGVLTGAGKQSPHQLADDFSVIFHELCHSLYDSQSEAVKAELDRQFTERLPPYGRLANAWINESLATAIGGGWAFSLALGKKEKDKRSNWYNQPTVDLYARELFPLVQKYLEEKKPIDQHFVNQAVDLFARAFPDSPYAWDKIFWNVNIVHDKSILDSKSIKELVRKEFPDSRMGVGAPLANHETISSVKEIDGTFLAIVGQDEAQKLRGYVEQFPFLQQKMTEIITLPPRNIFAALDASGRAFVIIRADNKIDLQQAFERLKAAQKMDAVIPVQAY